MLSDNVYEKPEADTHYTASVTRQHSRYDKNINSPGGCGNTRYIDNLLHVKPPVLYQIWDMASIKYSRYFFHDYKAMIMNEDVLWSFSHAVANIRCWNSWLCLMQLFINCFLMLLLYML